MSDQKLLKSFLFLTLIVLMMANLAQNLKDIQDPTNESSDPKPYYEYPEIKESQKMKKTKFFPYPVKDDDTEIKPPSPVPDPSPTEIDGESDDHTEDGHTDDDYTEDRPIKYLPDPNLKERDEDSDDHTEDDHSEDDHTEDDHTEDDHTEDDHSSHTSDPDHKEKDEEKDGEKDEEKDEEKNEEKDVHHKKNNSTSHIHDPNHKEKNNHLKHIKKCNCNKTKVPKNHTIKPIHLNKTHSKWVNLYRYWNETKSDHFYTTNASEIGTKKIGEVGKCGYKCEGITGQCLAKRCGSSVPLYRYWHPIVKDHFYTSNADEIGTTTPGVYGNYGYMSEGIQCHVYPNSFTGLKPLYRYWNAGVSDHFYTLDASEIGTTTPGIVGNFGYKSEGIAAWIRPPHTPRKNKKEKVPLYRYWNAEGTDHFYTTNCTEIGTSTPGVVGKYGYKSEGIAGHCLSKPHASSVPLYRYWNEAYGDHFYTINPCEIGTIIPGEVGYYGFISEGVQCYVFPASASGLLPLYRYWNPNNSDHFYTINTSEIGTTVLGQVGSYGYVSEGIAAWIYP